MTFRKMTFIFIAVLLSVLFFIQFWFIQSFTQDVASKIGESAFQVSRSTIETLMFRKHEVRLKSFAISSRMTAVEQEEILSSLSGISHDVNISLHDGQKDDFLTINASGSNYKVDIPRTGIEASLDEMGHKIFLSAIASIFIGLLAASYFSRRLASPLSDLQSASVRVGKGEFGFHVENQQKYKSVEIQNTIAAFNEMSDKIDQLQKENEVLQKQAQFSELSEITRGLAHTIRNPLNTLNLAIDELSTVRNHEEKQELAQISKHQVRRIDKWVCSLMDIMSSDSSLTEELDMRALLQSCIDDISLNNTTTTRIELRMDTSRGEEGFMLEAIQPELKSMLQSLMSNSVEAVESTENNSNNIVMIDLKQADGTIFIVIADHGIGFSDEVKAKLFTPHNTNKTYGAGMGLYLAHRIVTLKYNGTLEISDNQQQNSCAFPGACISITLNNRV